MPHKPGGILLLVVVAVGLKCIFSMLLVLISLAKMFHAPPNFIVRPH